MEAISPHCSEEQLRHLEQTILDYYPEQEKQAQWRQMRGYLQFTVLDGIIPSRRTLLVIRRLVLSHKSLNVPSERYSERETNENIMSQCPECLNQASSF